MITPNPSTSGSARWNILAAYGAAAEGGQDARAGARLRQDAADQERQRPGLERQRRAADVHQRQGRRAARLRERRDRGREGRRRDPVHHSQADDPDPDADRGHREELARQPRRRRSSTGCGRRRGRRSGPSRATARCSPSVAKQFKSKFPTPPQLFTIELPRRLDEGQEGRSSIRRADRSPRSSRQRGSPLPPASSQRVAPPRAARPPGRAPARVRGPSRRRSASASAMLYLSVIVLIPLAAVAAKAFSGGLGTLLGLGHRARSRLKALVITLVVSLIVAAIGAVMGTIVAWVLVRDSVPGQAVHQRADRPAVRAADDRRRADADRAVRARAARSASTSRTRGRRWWWRCCS